MRHLLILRHARAGWGSSELADHDRQLDTRGKVEARELGRTIAEGSWNLELILASTAKRTASTAHIVAESLAPSPEIRHVAALYTQGPEGYLEQIAGAGRGVADLAIVGHNPAVTQLLFLLSRVARALPTAGMAVLRVPITSWQEIREIDRADLDVFWHP